MEYNDIVAYCAAKILYLSFWRLPTWLKTLHTPPRCFPEAQGYRLNVGDSVELGVWYIPAVEKAERLVVYIHGQAGTRGQSHRKDLILMLSKRLNAHVIAYDPRGFGDSSGDSTPDGLIDDGIRVLKLVEELFKNSIARVPVYLWGHSLGGPQAVQIAAESHEIPINGIVLESTFTSFFDAAMEHFLVSPLRIFTKTNSMVHKTIESGLNKHFEGQRFRFSTIDALQKLKGKNISLKILHGSSDWVVSSKNAKDICASCPEGVAPSLNIIEGGGHNDLHTKHQDNLVNLMRIWFRALEN